MPGTKIVTRRRLKTIVAALKKRGERIVFTNGCFDLIHYGHVQYLQRARSKGGVLIVGLNTDASVRRLKGPQRPLVKLQERAAVLAALECVSFVTAFAEDTPQRLIEEIAPDVLVKGGDWKNKTIVGADAVRARGGTVTTIPYVPGRSTSELIEKITERFG